MLLSRQCYRVVMDRRMGGIFYLSLLNSHVQDSSLYLIIQIVIYCRRVISTLYSGFSLKVRCDVLKALDINLSVREARGGLWNLK